MLSGLFIIFVLVDYTRAITPDGKCIVLTSRTNNTWQYNCMGLTSLDHLGKAPENTTDIKIVDSAISVIPRYGFIKFSTLETLNLHRCGIAGIDPNAFVGLYQLKKLILWDNNLNWVTVEWFRDLINLRHLDISFNRITGMDLQFYSMLPNLKYFYFDYNEFEKIDYNMFPILGRLKEVKFGKNPWNWEYRVLLTWQFDNQKVDYRDDWENFEWVSKVVRECQDNGQEFNDAILNCALLKFLRMEVEPDYAISGPPYEQMGSGVACVDESVALIDCMMRSDGSRSGRDSARAAFESIISTIKFTRDSSDKFYYKT